MITSRIKVFFFIDSLMIGGMHRQVLNLVKHLNKDVFEPIMCTSSPKGGLREEFEQTGCKLIDLNWKRKIDPPIINRLIKILKIEEPDIIYITEAQNLIYYQISKIFWHKKVVQIGSFRALTFWLGHKNKLFQLIDIYLSRWLYSSSDYVIANSNAIKDHYSNIININPQNTIKVIYNGSDLNFPVSRSASEIRMELNISLKKIVIIMVARLDPWKDFKTFLEAAKIVVKTDKTVNFLIVGDGELRDTIEKMILQMNLKVNVFLLGEKKDVYNYINAADISVLSTNGEGFSNSLLESMALGKPVIATNVGGNSETLGIANESGILIPPKSPELFAEAIFNLIRNEDVRKNIGHAAKDRIQQLCNLEKYISSYEQLFKRSLEKNKISS